jgi:hypothetical protein
MGMGTSKGGAMPPPAPSGGGMSKGMTGAPPPSMAKGSGGMPAPLNSLAGGPKMFTQSATQGLIGGLGAPQQQNPGFTFGGGYYGGDALGTAGQLLAGGPPSLDPSKAGQTQAIGNFGPNAVTNPNQVGGSFVPGAPGVGTPGGGGPDTRPTGGPPNIGTPPGTPGAPGTSMPPGMDPSNFGPSPTPPVGGATQQYASNLLTPHTGGAPGSTGAQYAAYLAARPNSLQAQKIAAMPQSFSPAQFNAVAARDPVLANAMASQGGQTFQNAIMQSNGWSPAQMNSFLNANGSGMTPGIGPQQLALLKSMGIG